MPVAPATPQATYLRYWDAVVAAHRSCDPAPLAAVAAEPQLGRVRAAIARNRTQQLSVRGKVGHRPRPAATRGDTTTLVDCYDISDWNPVDLRTGQPVDAAEAGGAGRYLARFPLRRAGAGWPVVDQAAPRGS